MRQLTPEEEATKLAAYLAVCPSQVTHLRGEGDDGNTGDKAESKGAPIFSTVKVGHLF